MVPGVVPSDIEIRRNYFFKPLSWRQGHPTFAGTRWLVKNLFETKNSRRLLIEGNIFENNWVEGQGAFAVVLTPRSGDSGPAAVNEDITFRKNIIRHSGQGANILGRDDADTVSHANRISFTNNIWEDINSNLWGGDGKLFQVLKDVQNLTIENNTGFVSSVLLALWSDGVNTAANFTFRNNIVPYNTYGIHSAEGGGKYALDWHTSSYTFEKNVLILNRYDPQDYYTTPEYYTTWYPPETFFPTSISSVGFTSYNEGIGGDYTLLSSSPYKNAGTDGKDVGADIAAVRAATDGVETGAPTPPTVSITAPATGATVSGSSVTVSADASDNIGVAGVQFKLDGMNLGAEVTAAPYTATWDTTTASNGSHTLTAVARDAVGNTTTSGGVSVTVSNNSGGGSSGSSSGGGGCFIATAAFGSAMEPKVLLLRAFRDRYLLQFSAGRGFVTWYYQVSPAAAAKIQNSPALRLLTRGALWPLVGFVWLIFHPWFGLALVAAGGGWLGWRKHRMIRTEFGIARALLFLPFVLCQADPVSAAAVPPEPPRVTLDTTMPDTSEYAVVNVAAGGDLQSAIDAAGCGTVLKLEAGATFTGTFIMRDKGDCGGRWIVLPSSKESQLPSSGTRVNLAHAGLMPKITNFYATEPVIRTESSANHYRLVGLEIASSNTNPSYSHYNMIYLGNESATTEDRLPHHIYIDRCYIHGTPTGGVRRGVTPNGNAMAVVDSYISDIHELGYDSQAICGWDGSGPFKIVNNHLEGSGENVMFGGAKGTVPNLIGSDIEFRRNYIYKPLTWKVGDPSYAGTPWTVKNLFELKNAQRILMEGNIFENNWAHAQSGTAIVLTPRSADVWPNAVVNDVTFRNNIVRHSGMGIGFSGADDYDHSKYPLGSVIQQNRLLIENNVWEDLGAKWGGSGWIFEEFWNTTPAANGPHTLTAVARDTAGKPTTRGEVSVTVSNSSGGVGTSGAGGGGGGCFIATAVYGSALEPRVVLLRTFRDRWLSGNAGGRAFVRWYGRVSPPLAARVQKSPALRRLVQGCLWPVIGAIRWIVNP